MGRRSGGRGGRLDVADAWVVLVDFPGQGGQRRADLSSVLRRAVVEGGEIVPRGLAFRRERRDVFPGQRRTLVHMADDGLGRRPPGEGRSSAVPGARGPRRLRLRPRARRRAEGVARGDGPVRDLLAADSVLVRGQRRHDLRRRLPVGRVLLPAVRPGRDGATALALGGWRPARRWGPSRSPWSSSPPCWPRPSGSSRGGPGRSGRRSLCPPCSSVRR